MKPLPSIVVVTTPTRFQGLVGRWGTKGQAQFRLRQAALHRQLIETSSAGPSSITDEEATFALYEAENAKYQASLDRLRDDLDFGYPLTLVERRYLPTYEFRNAMVVVVIGPDGLVANTAKYVGDLPIVGINPDPQRIDGILVPFDVPAARGVVEAVLNQRFNSQPVTMAEAVLNDGQSLLAFNDLFIGRRTHVSARYNLRWKSFGESQSSSGVIVATGAGSTGWLSSVFNMTRGITAWSGTDFDQPSKMAWNDRRLAWVVREPFASRFSQAELVVGLLEQQEELILESLMPEGGAIFSDGIEDDFLEFNSGSTVRIRIAQQQARLVIP
jgi:hypothetical protein